MKLDDLTRKELVDIIKLQQKHYADAIEKCARLAGIEGLPDLVKAIRSIGWTTGVETLQLVAFEKAKVLKEVEPEKFTQEINISCLPGHSHHKWDRKFEKCVRCGISYVEVHSEMRNVS